MEEMSFPKMSMTGGSGTDYTWEGAGTGKLPPTLCLTSHPVPHLIIRCLSTLSIALHPFIICEQCLISRAGAHGEWGWKKEGIIIHQGLESDEIYTLPQP